MWGMLLNHRDWLLKPDSFSHRLDYSGREIQRTVCTTKCAIDIDRAEDQSYFHASPTDLKQRKTVVLAHTSIQPAYLWVVLHDTTDLLHHVNAALAVQGVNQLGQVGVAVPDGPVLQCGVRPLVI